MDLMEDQSKDVKTMKKKTILLLSQDDLLSNFVAHLLSDQTKLDVMAISIDQNPEEILKSVENLHLDVVISQEGYGNSASTIMPILFSNNPSLKVIRLNLSSNLMEIYNKQNILVQSAADLISAIEM